jgi:hypothetical protein
LITALILFFPIGIAAYGEAIRLHVSAASIIWSGVFGALIMAYPIILIKTKDLPFFKQ